jgi:HK97 family phage major capsid protein
MDEKQFKALVKALMAGGLSEEDATKRAEAEKAKIEKAAAEKAEAEAAKKAKEEQEARINAVVDAAVKEAMKELEPANTKGAKLSVPAINKVSGLGLKDDAMKSFMYWIRTGDEGAVKAALQGQTDTEGGYLVPDDFYNNVVAKRDELSVARRAGAAVIQTSLDRVLVPTEGTSMTAFAITTEESAVSEEEPTFGQVALTVHRATKLVKISVQLAADEKARMEPFLTNAFARAEASWENTYFLEGSGGGQPLGAVDGGTNGKTAAGTNAITAAEVVALFHALDEPYHGPGCAWSMKMSTLGYLRGLSGSAFYFQQTPAGDILPGLYLEGYPVYPSAIMAAMTSSLKPVILGNWQFYFIAERQGLSIQRLTELYAGNGQIGLLATFRRGGAPTQAEAFQYLTLS